MTGVTVWHSLSCRERGRCAAHDSGGDMHKAGGGVYFIDSRVGQIPQLGAIWGAPWRWRGMAFGGPG